MPENYDHYISKNIKAFYKRRLAAPIIYLIVLMLAWHFFSLSAVFSPDISGLSVFISLDFTGYGCLLPQISGLLLLRILPAGNLPDD